MEVQKMLGICLLIFFSIIQTKASIDLSACHALIPDLRLPKDVVPKSYNLYLEPQLEEKILTGVMKIDLSWSSDSKKISLHAHYDLNINDRKIQLYKVNTKDGNNSSALEKVTILRGDRLPRKSVYVIYLKETIKQGSEYTLEMPFEGSIWENAEGLFKGCYVNSTTSGIESYMTTYLRPNNARKVFPCFDEPEYKVPFTVSIARNKEFLTLFNSPLLRSEPHSSLKDYIVDYFETTPPMSTFTFGLLISKLHKYTPSNRDEKEFSPILNIWSNDIDAKELQELHQKLVLIAKGINEYVNISNPLKKIDVIAIPDISLVRPADNWGLLIFKERELLRKGYYSLAQELIYQWIGSWVTPQWWSDAHINKALASFIATEIVMQIDNGVEFNGKYPMTVLYSLYYEFSKRYPHSRITGMKQEATSFKTEMVIRMLNYTLGKDAFKDGIRQIIATRQYNTFSGEDLWRSLTDQAVKAGTLSAELSITEIADSWITKNRLPVVNVKRDYEKKTASVHQKVYLRERPHDVPEQDKMLWWIPIILNVQDDLNFSNTSPRVWMKNSRQLEIPNMPEEDRFIIINHEEIGPFPVNYDEKNWYMLSNYLKIGDARASVPTLTRAKLLHDAWNLAYAGDLSFATALNMTLFMRFERNHIVWNPVFTFVDHIGRHIDQMSAVHKKFESYVTTLLAPLYEELGTESDTEETWKTDLRALAKTFLCRAGYRPCIEEAQRVFQTWQDSPDPNLENPIHNQYICPVFKWGSMDEWEFGLERVIQFPKSRVQSERTYLLKTLAGCPVQPEKINRLLQLTIIEENSNFTENDIFLIFNMLTGGSSGYTTLFNFLSENWDIVRQKFDNKTNLWDSLIGSATGVFTTQEGYNMVKKLYEDHKGQFESAEHIIEKSLRNIKEEAKWSDENLPVIEKWLDSFLFESNKNNRKFLGK